MFSEYLDIENRSRYFGDISPYIVERCFFIFIIFKTNALLIFLFVYFVTLVGCFARKVA